MGFIDLAAPVDIWQEQSVQIHYDDVTLEIQRVEWRNLTDSTINLLIQDGGTVLIDQEIRPFETNEQTFPAGYHIITNDLGRLVLTPELSWHLKRRRHKQ